MNLVISPSPSITVSNVSSYFPRKLTLPLYNKSQKRRHEVKPGITGWAQVNGYRGEITNAEQIKMRVNKDVWYLENWTLWLDIRILFLTVYYILRGDKKAF